MGNGQRILHNYKVMIALASQKNYYILVSIASHAFYVSVTTLTKTTLF